MTNDGVGTFIAAFGGSMLIYFFGMAVEYRRDPDNFKWAGWRDLVAQCAISLVITALTFMTFWRSIQAQPSSCNWMCYVQAATEAMLLELLLQFLSENRPRHRRPAAVIPKNDLRS